MLLLIDLNWFGFFLTLTLNIDNFLTLHGLDPLVQHLYELRRFHFPKINVHLHDQQENCLGAVFRSTTLIFVERLNAITRKLFVYRKNLSETLNRFDGALLDKVCVRIIDCPQEKF